MEASDYRELSKEQIKQLRVKSDELIQLTGKHRKGRYGREMALAHTNAQLLKMWLGKCIEAIDAPLPAEFRDEYQGEHLL